MGGRHGRQSDYMVVSCSLLQSIRTARPVDWDVKEPGVWGRLPKPADASPLRAFVVRDQ